MNPVPDRSRNASVAARPRARLHPLVKARAREHSAFEQNQAKTLSMSTVDRRVANRRNKAAETARKRKRGLRAISLFLTEDDLRGLGRVKVSGGYPNRSKALQAVLGELVRQGDTTEAGGSTMT